MVMYNVILPKLLQTYTYIAMEICNRDISEPIPLGGALLSPVAVNKSLIEAISKYSTSFNFNGDIHTISMEGKTLMQKILFKQPLEENVNVDTNVHKDYVFYPYITTKDVESCNISRCSKTVGDDKKIVSITTTYLPMKLEDISTIHSYDVGIYNMMLPIADCTRLHCAYDLNYWREKYVTDGRKVCINRHDVKAAVLLGYTKLILSYDTQRICPMCFEGIIRIPAVIIPLADRQKYYDCSICNSTVDVIVEGRVELYEKIEGTCIELLK